MRKVFALSAVMTKSEPMSQVTTLMQGWRFTETKDEALGSFLESCKEAKPGFAVLDMLAMEIPQEQIAKMAAEQSNASADMAVGP